VEGKSYLNKQQAKNAQSWPQVFSALRASPVASVCDQKHASLAQENGFGSA
jgi:hypothetical protein